MAALIEGAPRKIFLVVDSLRVHHAKGVCAWLAEHKDKIELAFLPPYASESNPDEYLNRDLKTALRTGPVSSDKDSLIEKALAFMNQLTTLPEKVRAYFRHPAAAYHFEHNYGHGKLHLSALLATLFLLAYLVHTVLDRLRGPYRSLRERLPSRRTFFEHLRALALYLPFENWEHLFAFMLEALQPAQPRPKASAGSG